MDLVDMSLQQCIRGSIFIHICICVFVYLCLYLWHRDSQTVASVAGPTNADAVSHGIKSSQQLVPDTCTSPYIHIYTFIETQKYIFIHCIEICLGRNMWTSISRISMYTNTKYKGCHKKLRYLSNCTLILCVLFLFQDWNYIFRNL